MLLKFTFLFARHGKDLSLGITIIHDYSFIVFTVVTLSDVKYFVSK